VLYFIHNLFSDWSPIGINNKEEDSLFLYERNGIGSVSRMVNTGDIVNNKRSTSMSTKTSTKKVVERISMEKTVSERKQVFGYGGTAKASSSGRATHTTTTVNVNQMHSRSDMLQMNGGTMRGSSYQLEENVDELGSMGNHFSQQHKMTENSSIRKLDALQQAFGGGGVRTRSSQNGSRTSSIAGDDLNILHRRPSSFREGSIIVDNRSVTGSTTSSQMRRGQSRRMMMVPAGVLEEVDEDDEEDTAFGNGGRRKGYYEKACEWLKYVGFPIYYFLMLCFVAEKRLLQVSNTNNDTYGCTERRGGVWSWIKSRLGYRTEVGLDDSSCYRPSEMYLYKNGLNRSDGTPSTTTGFGFAYNNGHGHRTTGGITARPINVVEREDERYASSALNSSSRGWFSSTISKAVGLIMFWRKDEQVNADDDSSMRLGVGQGLDEWGASRSSRLQGGIIRSSTPIGMEKGEVGLLSTSVANRRMRNRKVDKKQDWSNEADSYDEYEDEEEATLRQGQGQGIGFCGFCSRLLLILLGLMAIFYAGMLTNLIRFFE
jgi:hypothetical protein